MKILRTQCTTCTENIRFKLKKQIQTNNTTYPRTLPRSMSLFARTPQPLLSVLNISMGTSRGCCATRFGQVRVHEQYYGSLGDMAHGRKQRLHTLLHSTTSTPDGRLNANKPCRTVPISQTNFFTERTSETHVICICSLLPAKLVLQFRRILTRTLSWFL